MLVLLDRAGGPRGHQNHLLVARLVCGSKLVDLKSTCRRAPPRHHTPRPPGNNTLAPPIEDNNNDGVLDADSTLRWRPRSQHHEKEGAGPAAAQCAAPKFGKSATASATRPRPRPSGAARVPQATSRSASCSELWPLPVAVTGAAVPSSPATRRAKAGGGVRPSHDRSW